MQVSSTTGSSFDPQLAIRAGDIGEEAAALAVQGGLQSETTENDIASSQEQIEATASSAQVQAMRAKAEEVRTAGILDGCVGMTAGALQAGSAACDVAATASASGIAAGRLRADGEWFKAAATGLEGGGKLADAFFAGSELSDDATAKAQADVADRASQAAKEAHDAASADLGVVGGALGAAAQIEQANANVNLAVAQRV
ncbi:MAG TPA: hypothetical protein VEK07_04625 [Polyangiaceae bacterium]|nr:hypothetical protein [Polyangiaceae bacterium]